MTPVVVKVNKNMAVTEDTWHKALTSLWVHHPSPQEKSLSL